MPDDRLAGWHNRYEGKSCFIVGNGRSLLKTPLHKLWHTFATNKVYMHEPWVPQFYFVTSQSIREWREDMMKTVRHAIPTFACEWADLNGWPNVYKMSCDREGFSHDPTERISKLGGSLFPMMQMAVFMGFDTLYLVGCDLYQEATNGDINHPTNDYIEHTTQGMADGWNQEIIRAHKRAKAEIEGRGLAVYNATLGGNLEVYERVDLWSLL